MPDTVHGARPPSLTADAGPASAGYRALDRLLAAHGPDGLLAPRPPAVAAAVDAAVRTLCAEARQASPGRAERLVIELRAAWPTLPAVRALPPGDGGAALLSQLVARAIAEFYRPADPAA